MRTGYLTLFVNFWVVLSTSISPTLTYILLLPYDYLQSTSCRKPSTSVTTAQLPNNIEPVHYPRIANTEADSTGTLAL